MLKKVSRSVLKVAEAFYLFCRGWDYEGDDFWTAPPSHPKPHKNIHQGHAINSCKHYEAEENRDANVAKVKRRA